MRFSRDVYKRQSLIFVVAVVFLVAVLAGIMVPTFHIFDRVFKNYEMCIRDRDIRYSCNQKDFKRYTTEEMRDEMLITGLYKADEVVAVYSHVDRMVTLGCMPVHETVSIDKGIDVWANFGTHYLSLIHI